MKTRWRLIEDGPASGGWNMGVDEALLATAVEGVATFRLYSLDGPWLSLGYDQRFGEAIAEAGHQVGVGAVRRATGRRAAQARHDTPQSIARPQSALPASPRGP